MSVTVSQIADNTAVCFAFRITGPLCGEPPVTDGFPFQRTSNADENAIISVPADGLTYNTSSPSVGTMLTSKSDIFPANIIFLDLTSAVIDKILQKCQKRCGEYLSDFAC